MASQASSSSKRKLADEEELEINLDAPEPPSKKAKRKEKRAQSSSTRTCAIKAEPPAASETLPTPTADGTKSVPETAPKRSEYGVWIGNLPFTATKESVREFLLAQGGIGEEDIIRLHLPTTVVTDAAKGKKTQNKGFAYVDFNSEVTMQLAISLSEKLLKGRRVLIKDSKSFEGRPEKTDKPSEAAAGTNNSGREPTKKIFVGNLGFDVTKEDLIEHFSQAGDVEDIFMATFEDSGKCKGFAWLRFATLEAAQAAVKGFIHRDPPDEPSDDDENDDENSGTVVEKDSKTKAAKGTKKRKPQKWFINRLNGRQLRCEFAEDAQTRYKKRYGKESKAGRDKENPGFGETSNAAAETASGLDLRSVEHKAFPPKANSSHPDKEQRREDRRRRHEKLDARSIAPGKALANAPRASGAIVAGKGTKMIFDD